MGTQLEMLFYCLLIVPALTQDRYVDCNGGRKFVAKKWMDDTKDALQKVCMDAGWNKINENLTYSPILDCILQLEWAKGDKRDYYHVQHWKPHQAITGNIPKENALELMKELRWQARRWFKDLLCAFLNFGLKSSELAQRRRISPKVGTNRITFDLRGVFPPKSVVIHGIPELSGEKRPSERQVDVEMKVTEILDVLGVEARPSAIFRMGRATEGKPRLTKVTLPSRSHCLAVLSKARLLRNNHKYKNIFIRPSQTVEERRRDFELRKEAREKNQALSQKNIHGIQR
ncbi:unnamed protein product [Cylicocyclus nassatus]|uniref:Uncharacterized protein n=1 Tax=Cylicocyclus nassatus TaxID=53992 RepID=A0AA36DPL8_CYLNA|nr:unnamed protein product [Cylicocyclus nassatus]